VVNLSGVGSAVNLSARSISYSGTQLLGVRSTARLLTVTNTGATPLTVSQIMAIGDFSQTNTCGSSLGPGANCSVSVSFVPTASGLREGGLYLLTSDPASPQMIYLGGTGTAVSLSSSKLVFPKQKVGTSSSPQAVTLTLTNTASTALVIGTITSSGDFSQTNNCGSSLAPGGNCSINVTFTPTATGTRTGTLAITNSDFTSPQSVQLTGTGF
jgi:hypothetical protein